MDIGMSKVPTWIQSKIGIRRWFSVILPIPKKAVSVNKNDKKIEEVPIIPATVLENFLPQTPFNKKPNNGKRGIKSIRRTMD
jgi:hypothetical protein